MLDFDECTNYLESSKIRVSGPATFAVCTRVGLRVIRVIGDQNCVNLFVNTWDTIASLGRWGNRGPLGHQSGVPDTQMGCREISLHGRVPLGGPPTTLYGYCSWGII